MTSLSSFYHGSRQILQLLKWPCHTSFFTHVEPYSALTTLHVTMRECSMLYVSFTVIGEEDSVLSLLIHVVLWHYQDHPHSLVVRASALGVWGRGAIPDSITAQTSNLGVCAPQPGTCHYWVRLPTGRLGVSIPVIVFFVDFLLLLQCTGITSSHYSFYAKMIQVYYCYTIYAPPLLLIWYSH